MPAYAYSGLSDCYKRYGDNTVLMKLVVFASTLDLAFRLGCTPAWWQLFKALHETGNEVVVIPYLGKPVQSIWWRTYDNPCATESVAYNSFLEWRKSRSTSPSSPTILAPLFRWSIKHRTRPRFERRLFEVLRNEKGVDCLLFMNIPINHMNGVPSAIKREIDVPIIYYDGDMPTSLPSYAVSRGFKFNYYVGANLAEYDAFLTNSEGCISDLLTMGAKNVYPFHYGVDPDLCAPVDIEQDIDVSFYGHGSDLREQWMQQLITGPSEAMLDLRFVVGGDGFDIDLGRARTVGKLSYSEWRYFCCRSSVNLNITRSSHTSIYASSTSRPFELAAFGACIVSQPYNGIEKWFTLGKEMIVVNSQEEAVDAYSALVSDPEKASQIGKAARKRVLKEHTFKHRALQLCDIIKSIEL